MPFVFSANENNLLAKKRPAIIIGFSDYFLQFMHGVVTCGENNGSSRVSALNNYVADPVDIVSPIIYVSTILFLIRTIFLPFNSIRGSVGKIYNFTIASFQAGKKRMLYGFEGNTLASILTIGNVHELSPNVIIPFIQLVLNISSMLTFVNNKTGILADFELGVNASDSRCILHPGNKIILFTGLHRNDVISELWILPDDLSGSIDYVLPNSLYGSGRSKGD